LLELTGFSRFYTFAVGGNDGQPPKLTLSGSIPDRGAYGDSYAKAV